MYLIILAHPDKSSFNKGIAEMICRQFEQKNLDFRFLDLYRESFNPVMPGDDYLRGFSFDRNIQLYNRYLEEADHLVFIHPDWWGMMPAILKGWLDRVFTKETAFDFEGEEFETKEKSGLLSEKGASVIITTDRENPPFPLIEIWKKDILGYCGIDNPAIFVHYNTRNSSPTEKKIFTRNIIGSIINK